jgi:hypothetical protein
MENSHININNKSELPPSDPPDQQGNGELDLKTKQLSSKALDTLDELLTTGSVTEKRWAVELIVKYLQKTKPATIVTKPATALPLACKPTDATDDKPSPSSFRSFQQPFGDGGFFIAGLDPERL